MTTGCGNVRTCPHCSDEYDEPVKGKCPNCWSRVNTGSKLNEAGQWVTRWGVQYWQPQCCMRVRGHTCGQPGGNRSGIGGKGPSYCTFHVRNGPESTYQDFLAWQQGIGKRYPESHWAEYPPEVSWRLMTGQHLEIAGQTVGTERPWGDHGAA